VEDWIPQRNHIKMQGVGKNELEHIGVRDGLNKVCQREGIKAPLKKKKRQSSIRHYCVMEKKKRATS